MEYDLFISHASEDKDLVRPLATSLRDRGYVIWYDEFVLRIGDSLTERIDYGLANSTAGLIILSPAFTAKPWPKRELAGLVARQLTDATRLIPIWHHLQISEVIRFSPPLADIKALHSGIGVDAMVREISTVVTASKPERDGTIEYAQEVLERGDYWAAEKLAFFALDGRLIGLIDGMRRTHVLPSEFRIPQHPEAVWEAFEVLQQLGRIDIPASVDLEFLKDHWEDAVGRWSHAAHAGPSQSEVCEVVSQVAAILRGNPIQPS